MKLILNITLFLFVLVIWEGESLSLTDYKIKRICKKEKFPSICIKNLQEKRLILKKGNQIEIPIIPYKK